MPKTKNMNRFLIVLSLACMMGFITGCASTRVDSAWLNTLSHEETRVGMGAVVSYMGPPGSENQSGIGAAFGMVGVMVDSLSTAAKQKQSRSLFQQRTANCVRSIEEVLVNSRRFGFVSGSDYGVASLATKEEDKVLLGMISQKGWNVGLSVKLYYAFAAGWKKKPSLIAVWRMVSSDGHERVKIKTQATASTASEVFPDLTSVNYDAAYVQLASENAKAFLKFLETFDR